MADIRIDFPGSELVDGQIITFQAPCDCTAIDKLKVYYRQGEELVYKLFTMKDSLGNTLSGIGNLFASGAYVNAILDTTNNFAYLQNASNNGYVQNQLNQTFPYLQKIANQSIEYWQDYIVRYKKGGFICNTIQDDGIAMAIVSRYAEHNGGNCSMLVFGYMGNPTLYKLNEGVWSKHTFNIRLEA